MSHSNMDTREEGQAGAPAPFTETDVRRMMSQCFGRTPEEVKAALDQQSAPPAPAPAPQPRAQPIQGPPRAPREMRLPEFDGNRANLRPWITQTTLILGTRGYRDWEEMDKVAALLGSVRGEAARFMGPWVEKQELVGLTVLRFFAQLRSAFGDELTQHRALKELETLKQGKKPYQEFYTKFARLVSEAEGDDWPHVSSY